MKNQKKTSLAEAFMRQPRLQLSALCDFPYLREPLLEVDLPCQ